MSTFPEHIRPDWDAWALGLAYAVGPGPSGRADCTRRRVGAVIIEPRRHLVIGVGYNGGMPGGPSCLKGHCPRGRHYPGKERWPDGNTRIDVCACGEDWPCPHAVLPGSSYDTGPGVCIASHAEQNALANVTAPERLAGATMYVTAEPCAGCVRQVTNTTEIVAIVWPEGRIDCRYPVAKEGSRGPLRRALATFQSGLGHARVKLNGLGNKGTSGR